VSAEPRLEGVETSEEFMKSVMNELRGVEKLEIHDINVTMVIDGKNTSKIDTIQGESGDFHNNDYFIVDEANDTMHRLSFITRENRYAEYQPIFDRMATSFRVQ
jgi:hypothetical protein